MAYLFSSLLWMAGGSRQLARSREERRWTDERAFDHGTFSDLQLPFMI